MIHSVPAAAAGTPCWTVSRRPDPRLRRHVLAYSGFSTATPIPHRILPINVPALVIDLTGACRVVTGPSATPVVGGQSRWGHGVTVGLTPAGASALLGVPTPELVGQVVPLDDVVLPEQLAATTSWDARFALLNRWLAARLDPAAPEDPLVTAAWWRLQRGPGRARAGAVAAALGVSRRRLETGFQRAIGLSPGTVSRIARFQRATVRLLSGAPIATAAADTGYADQPHLTRDVRAFAGLTPTALRALVAPASVPVAHSFKTRPAGPA
ncbi:helix-turn-helix domain-containing protein [Actinoplanes utahensis]|uniref:helix-turn-helix domain-containing protein n=1 Tax=Actinoplanes utahensis TaxID=1869 RepID=UPI00068E46A0|nr:helix-turn-helix domain-containing protein [Actinoplanes utahensis]GIF35014.1 hypothetical protein Aut01nite_80000 [Actinoplanes utahensis]